MKAIIFLLFQILIINSSLGQKFVSVLPINQDITNIIKLNSTPNDYIIYKSKGKYFTLQENTNFLTTELKGIDSVFVDKNTLFAKENDLWGVYDLKTSSFSIPAVYEKLLKIKDSDMFFASKYGATCLIDNKNKKLAPYVSSYNMINNYKLLKIGVDQYIYTYKMNDSLKFIKISTLNNEVTALKNLSNLIKVDDLVFYKYVGDDYWSLEDSKNGNKITFKTDFIPSEKCKNYIFFRYRNKFSLFDIQGKEVITSDFSNISFTKKCDEIFVWKNKNCGLLSISKGILLEPKYYSISPMDENNELFSLNENQKYSIYSVSKNQILDSLKFEIKVGNNYLVKKINKYGLLDSLGNLKFNFDWTYYKKISNDIVIIGKNDKEAVYNGKLERFLTLFNTYKFESFNKYFIRKTDINKQVSFLTLDMTDINIPEFGNWNLIEDSKKYLIFKDKNKFYGITDYKLNILIPFKYNDIKILDEESAILIQNGKSGIMKLIQ